MQTKQRVNLLGAPVDAITMEQAGTRVADMIRSGQHGRVITLNPEFLYRAAMARSRGGASAGTTAGTGNGAGTHPDAMLMDLVHQADLVTADGEGILWAGRVAGTPFPQRVTGIDLLLHLAREAAVEGWRVYLLGSAPGVAREAADNLQNLFPGLQVAGTHHGYFTAPEEPEVVRQVARSRPQLLFVALGAPRQELWIHRYLEQLEPGVVAMGVGGSFDVIAGRVPRAPVWMQRLRLEWLGRLVREPSRWRRMLVLPKFMWLVLKTYR